MPYYPYLIVMFINCLTKELWLRSATRSVNCRLHRDVLIVVSFHCFISQQKLSENKFPAKGALLMSEGKGAGASAPPGGHLLYIRAWIVTTRSSSFVMDFYDIILSHCDLYHVLPHRRHILDDKR